jgi:hypothetical protein
MVDSSSGQQPPGKARQAKPGTESRSGQPSSDSADRPTLPVSLLGDRAMWRFAGAGMELGGSAILCAAIGYALDRYLDNTTLIATALGAVIGFAAGLYRFIRMAMAANQSATRR